jgi:Fur family ferric uptake transcriptional regulator
MNDVTQVLQRIHDSGGRLTTTTRVIVSLLAEPGRHLTAEDLIGEIDRATPGVAASTVYRVLQRLEDLGLLEHVHCGGSAAFYHLVEHGHAHLVCTSCGEITDLSHDAAEALRRFEHATRTVQGFVVDAHHAALLGRCERCAHRPSDSSHRSEPSGVR